MSNYIPKIRIRVPKWQAVRSASWAKELLMTFIGATLSIVLTFGTAHFVDQKQKLAEGRQTAMMVIHDMEQTAELFREYAKEEEKSYNYAQYVLANMDRIDSISVDTLTVVVYLITSSAGPMYYEDDASEKVFLNSQDAWKNIDNPSFIDAVQAFYRDRRVVYDALNADQFFKRPVPNDEYYAYLQEKSLLVEMDNAFIVPYLREQSRKKTVLQFINYSFLRRRFYNQYADSFTSYANKCKFMMGITDDELAAYVQKMNRTGKQLKTKQLIGQWKLLTTAEMDVERDFRRDHTFEYRIVNYVSYAYYTGQVEFRYVLHGTWELQGDSLITFVEPDYEYEIDHSKINYQPELASSIDALFDTWKQNIEASMHEEEQKGVQRRASFASIDATGNKIELRSEDEDTDDPSQSETTFYLMRL